MKKITILLFFVLSITGFSQSKSTGVISMGSNMTANFTLNNTTSRVTLVLTGPSDRWFGLGLGVVSGFGMGAGDVVVYTTTLTDRRFNGTGNPPSDSSQDWTTTSDNVNSTTQIRTLTLERALTNSDTANDLQLPYASTNTINVAWARANTANTTTPSSNHSVGFASGTFTTTLGVEDLSLNAASVYPNPSSGSFFVTAKTSLSKINMYSQLGALIKTINVAGDSRQIAVSTDGLQSGVYLLELQNESEKSWKKVIVN